MRYFYLKATLCSDFLSVTFKNRLRPFGSLHAHYPTVHQHLTPATSSHGKRRGPHAPGLSPAEKPRSGARGRAGKGGGGRGGEDQTQSLELLVSLEETHSPLAQKIKFRGKRGVLMENVIFGIKDPSVHSHKPSFTTLPG